jgi:hypothetical protein
MSNRLVVKSTQTEQADAAQVLKILNNWDRKFQGHHQEKRGNQRVPYSAPMRLHRRKSHLSAGETDSGLIVWARNISPTGVGFVSRTKILSRRAVLCLDPTAGGKSLFRIEIVRTRKVHNDFWEYGARFTGRASEDDILPGGPIDAADLEPPSSEAM